MRFPLVIAAFITYCIGIVDSRLCTSCDTSGNERYRHRKLIQHDSEDSISRHYIVHLKNDTSDDEIETKAKEVAMQSGGKILWIYKSIFKGFSISLGSDSHIANLLDRDDIDVMEQDVRVTLDDVEMTPDGPDVDYKQIGDEVPKGLDRIDQVGLPLDDVYNYKNTGKNVTVYILDTGIKLDHVDFQGRATCGLDTFRKFVKNEFFEQFDDDFFDDLTPMPFCNDTVNHGTHVAGIIGGILSGVAKKTNIVSVKVISSSGGTASSILAGLEYVRLQKVGFPSKPMVVNMSLGSIYSKSVNRAVDRLVASGVVVVAAAGNRGINACLVSPASSRSAITVGAATTTERIFKNQDRRALYSNWGRCVDIFAPGNRILSASAANTTRFGINTGTSMAAPHVTGAVALYLERNPAMTPSEVREALMNDALSGRLMTIYQLFSANRLLHIDPQA